MANKNDEQSVNGAKSVFTAITPLPFETEVAMAYIPFQTDTAMFAPEEALCKGTLFTSLNKPFCQGAIK